ncbi:MAG TPA: protein translocase subunit SecD, partial [Blastocatellia bacterium]|nr:protein translocase subunit SecD [Blastocatellia bacterium]
MNRNLRTRSIIITVLTALCLILMFGPWHRAGKSAGDFFKPSKLKENLAENIKLGLDLRGGTHLVMQVQADDAIKA